MSRTAWDPEQILRQFRRWLEETAAEIERLPDAVEWGAESRGEESTAVGSLAGEFVPSHFFQSSVAAGDENAGDAGEGAADRGAAPLETAGDGWAPRPPRAALPETQSSGPGLPAAGVPLPLPRVGLQQLVEAFTALRHETKLQTKSARGLEEAVQAALSGLESARRQFQSVQAKETEAAERAARPYVDALLGLDESLWRAGKAFGATHRQMTQAAPERLRQALAGAFQQLPAWRRWAARPWRQQIEQLCADAFARSTEDEFATLMQGFQLIQQRLERALRECGVVRLDTVGKRVDPAQMTVIEMVDNPGVPPETVVEEVRPGYAWNGVVVRYAEVRAARHSSASLPAGD